MRTLTYVTLGAILGVSWLPTHVVSAKPDPIAICHKALNSSVSELKSLNVAAGMKPDAPFSIDDYCGYNCGADDRCLDSCRTCLNDEEGRTEQ